MANARRGRTKAGPAGAAPPPVADAVLYRGVFDQATVGIAITDGELRFVDVNPCACGMFGYSHDEMMRMSMLDLVVPEDRAEMPAQAGPLQAGRTISSVRRLRRRDGTEFLAEVSARALPNGTAVSILNDITVRSRAEQRLAESEARYGAVVERATVGITLTDAQWRFVEVNPQACEIFGRSREELLRLSVRDVAAPGELDRAPLQEPSLKAGRDSFSTRRVARPDGTVRVVEIGARGVGDEQIVSIVTDVTDRVEAARRLAESERSLERAQELAQFGTWEVDLVAYTGRWSAEMYRLFGVAPEHVPITYDLFVSLIHPEDRADMERRIRNAIEGRTESRAHEYRILHADGSVRIVSATMDAVRDEAGNVVRLVGSSQDMTERRLLEAQLREAQKLEAIGRLAGGVAHDFNNLLTVILGFTETMLDGMAEGDRNRAGAEQVRLSARRAAGLTQQLLAFGRRQMFRLEVFDLDAGLAEMKDILRRLIGEQIQITVSPEARHASIRADRGQIEQVILNLALNARDAMPAGGRLDISTANVAPPAAWTDARRSAPCLLLTVSDTGMGMSPEVLAHIFEPFYTTKDVGRGTGLGLATVHGIVSQTGGSIEVSSVPGGGTTFRVYLPCAVDGVPAEEPAAPAGEAGGDETVLVAEDDPAVRGLVAEVLRRRGYRVLEAMDGEEAVGMAAGHPGPVHLLITDMVMPGLGGPDLARRLLEVRPEVRVLLISGYSDEWEGASSLAAGSVTFLQKPFSPGSLALKVRELLDAPAGA